MNINNFDYEINPRSKIKRYQIHPLSEEGFSQYTNKVSYTHKYLKSLSPSRIDEIFNYKTLKNTRLGEEENKDTIYSADNSAGLDGH